MKKRYTVEKYKSWYVVKRNGIIISKHGNKAAAQHVARTLREDAKHGL